MSVPTFANPDAIPFSYSQAVGVTDVNTIISDVRAHLVTTLGWSEPSTALFKSPPQRGTSDTKFIDILLTRISATTLEIRIRDWRAQTLCTRRIQIDSTGAVNYFCSARSLVIESLRATPEIAQAYLLDVDPLDLSEVDNIVVANGYRDSASGVDGNGSSYGQLFAFDNATATVAGRCVSSRNNQPQTVSYMSGSATLMFTPVAVRINQAGTQVLTGRLPQAYAVDSTIAFGCDKTVPIDDSRNGVVRVIGLTTTNGLRMALRKT